MQSIGSQQAGSSNTCVHGLYVCTCSAIYSIILSLRARCVCARAPSPIQLQILNCNTRHIFARLIRNCWAPRLCRWVNAEQKKWLHTFTEEEKHRETERERETRKKEHMKRVSNSLAATERCDACVNQVDYESIYAAIVFTCFHIFPRMKNVCDAHNAPSLIHV